jgi:hypothetical protein
MTMPRPALFFFERTPNFFLLEKKREASIRSNLQRKGVKKSYNLAEKTRKNFSLLSQVYERNKREERNCAGGFLDVHPVQPCSNLYTFLCIPSRLSCFSEVAPTTLVCKGASYHHLWHVVFVDAA